MNHVTAKTRLLVADLHLEISLVARRSLASVLFIYCFLPPMALGS